MKFLKSSVLLLLAPVLLLGNSAGIQKAEAADEKPTIGTLQSALDAMSTSSYTKKTYIESYTLTSDYPYSEKNPLYTKYTNEGLYMVERGSGYYDYDNSIYRISIKDGVETRTLFKSDYQHYYSYYRTIRDFTGTYMSGHLVEDTSDTTGLTYKSVSTNYSTPDILSMVYFVAPLISVRADNATFSNYSFSFAFAKSGESYLLSKISVSLTVTAISGGATSPLISSAIFSDIGSTALPYSVNPA